MRMLTHLYRFRSLDDLLGEHAELRNQEIYFAAPHQLNDPMEGFCDVFWRGDKIVWTNLMRHFLRCLTRAYVLLTLFKEERPLGWDQIPVLQFTDSNISVEQKAIQEDIFKRFFSEELIGAYIEELAAQTRPIRRDELATHFRRVHMFALSGIYETFVARGLLPQRNPSPDLSEKLKEILAQSVKGLALARSPEANTADRVAFFDAVYAASRGLSEQLDFNHLYNGSIDQTRSNHNFVFLTFCEDYVKQIETLIYPEWHAACFLLDCRDSAIWAHYGAHHTGVCLKFRVKPNGERPTMPLTRVIGWAGDGPSYGKIDQEFFPIRYTKKHASVDFFRSLRLPVPTLRAYWYSDEAGNRSTCANPIMGRGNYWKKKYWCDFHRSMTTKLKAWRYEHEYRLILSGMHLDFSDPQLRKAKYEFDSLEAIIFGMKTPSKDKLAIAKVIEEKCRGFGRTDFKFYEARYSARTGTIEPTELGLLKFRSVQHHALSKDGMTA
jgi:hypothetical protein